MNFLYSHVCLCLIPSHLLYDISFRGSIQLREISVAMSTSALYKPAMPWPWPFSTSDNIFIWYHSAVGVIGVGLNSFALASIYHSPPLGLRNSKLILIVMTIVNLLESIASSLMMVRLIPSYPSAVYIYIGPCSVFEPRVCHGIMAVQMHFAILQCSLLKLAFINRFNIMRSREMMSDNLRIACFIAGYIPAFAIMILFAYNYTNPVLLRPAIMRAIPQYDFTNYRIIGEIRTSQLNNFNNLGLLNYIFISFYPLLVLIAVVILRILIKNRLRKDKPSLNKTMLSMLTYLIVHPLAMVIGNIFYFIAMIFDVHVPLLEYMTIGLWSAVSSISPMIFIVHLPSFKKFFRRTVRSMTRLAMSTSALYKPAMPWPWPFSTSDEIFIWYHSVVGVIGVSLNSFALLSIKVKSLVSPLVYPFPLPNVRSPLFPVCTLSISYTLSPLPKSCDSTCSTLSQTASYRPYSFRNFKLIILLMTIVNLLESCASALMMVRLIPSYPSAVYIYIGPCSVFEPRVCHGSKLAFFHWVKRWGKCSCTFKKINFSDNVQRWESSSQLNFRHFLTKVLAVQMHFAILQCSLLLFGFINRFNVIRSRELMSCDRGIPRFVAGYIPAFAIMILFAYNYTDSVQLREDILRAIPQYDFTNYRIIGQFNNFESLGLLNYIFISFFPLIVLVAAIEFRIMTQNRLDHAPGSISSHKNMLNLLTYQLVHPLAMVIGNIFYFIAMIFDVHVPLLEYMTIGLWSSVATISPIIFLIYLVSFRTTIFGRFYKWLWKSLTQRRISLIERVSNYRSTNQQSTTF
ncbi:hypothetical protein PRIPAC_81958 [Pristionchus pacificus]|uniref:G protein-coupled receptor n=1 Tax=Pristionchus pacificus TaxID=54126 RepID=A0A2A6C4H3_PRIPA|nr:hypothetical protein PRIPAC_81958 [Pristionchus pacificus]|eukprot:PDM73030.1 G protein-coupled receptor [Pristionchus pacificus]